MPMFSMFRSMKRLMFDKPAIAVQRFVPTCEVLDERIAPAVTKSFYAPTGVLRIRGDNLNNNIVVSRTATGFITVQGARVVGSSGYVKVSQVKMVVANGLGGNDRIVVNSWKGTLPRAAILLGGEGNDVLVGQLGENELLGGPGNDFLQGRGEANFLFGEAGDDIAFWNASDGNYHMFSGGDGNDVLRANGTAGLVGLETISGRAELLNASDGHAATIEGTENVEINASSVAVGDLHGMGVATVKVDLGSNGAVKEFQVNGTDAADVIEVVPACVGVNVLGLGAAVSVADVTQVQYVFIDGWGGNDVLSGAGLTVRLWIEAGAGDDVVIGSDANDVLQGGDGNDTIYGNAGDDFVLLGDGDDVFVWNAGDGHDVVDGQLGQDTIRFNGSSDDEIFTASSHFNYLLITRDVDGAAYRFDNMEILDLRMGAGIDQATLSDVALAGITSVSIDLTANGAGDGAADTVVIDGTASADTIQVAPDNGDVLISGLLTQFRIHGSESANDRLMVRCLAGNDTFTAGALADLIHITVDGGDGNDSITGGNGGDVLTGGPGDDTINGAAGDDSIDGGSDNDTLDGGDGTDISDGGDGTDTAINGEIVINVP
jgi:Ca2+-binding RTX toxin-like protein